MIDGGTNGTVLVACAIDGLDGGDHALGKGLEDAVVGGNGVAGVTVCWRFI